MSALAVKPRRPLESLVLPGIRNVDAESAGAVADWLASLEGRKAPRTIAQYVRTVDDLIGEHPDKTPGEFTDGDVERFLASYPLGSRKIRRSHLNSWFKYLYRRRLISENPIDFIEDYPSPPKPIHQIFTLTEIEQLCLLPQPDGVLMRFMFDTGLRAGELRRLQVRNVNLDENFVEIIRSKRDKSRLVPMTARLRLALEEWFSLDGMEPEAYLFYCSPGGHYRDHTHEINYTSFWRWFGKCLKTAGVEYRKPHTMRHSYGTWSKRAGVDTDDLRRNMGHDKISTTVEMYVHTSVEDRRGSADAFEAGTS